VFDRTVKKSNWQSRL